MKQPDPNTSTREVCTQFTLSIPCPPDANPKFTAVWDQYDKLLRLLLYHPAMSENIQQTFMTPANSKNKVYFIVDPSLSEASKQTQAFANLASRTMHSHVLIMDKTGLLEKMNKSVGYNHDAGVEFGKEIEDASMELKRLAMAM
ncbi:hypothetical protein MBLNU457_4039t1 [Dothideomycetes sp. NU457]